ncbi:7-dehydrocholesterol reductase [Cordyceps fumosorosea ARSEF 2679]|uniref:7-dehydrocholesterol reductase n=1 Tax=Cordyceps fumosorosea (strain ARSEF 2679) TaxID=1081104 RepID=A0A167HJH8_CORFA|nr:7-dehydrocholesterol reductase [Cordyceps fumosorosea ARSEF 2679]OAA47985.1 7-dehydrocholesterol reductase [Cordyceps fumosorosea ARSEF 2679]
MYEPPTTGRAAVILNEATSFLLVTTSPLFCFFCLIAYSDFASSLYTAAAELLYRGPVTFFSSYLPRTSARALAGYATWILFQALLYRFLPGPVRLGPRTCGGRRLLYRLNGLAAWATTVAAAVLAAYGGYVDPAVIAKNWGELFVAASMYCALLVTVFYVKARAWPDSRGETLLTGQFWYDLFNGGELHPRTGRLFDWKHFNASRTGGILLWTLIDLSFASWQYELHDTVTSTMIAAVVFRAIVVVDFFWYEHWFLETLDGCHERFSFYSIYGFAAMMPLLWTLQTQYLARHPFELSRPALAIACLLFAAGFLLNHDANGQRTLARRRAGVLEIWGRPARCVRAQYATADGKLHHTILLCSGWWGVARHANYLGSALYTLGACTVCGTGRALPYMEAVLVLGTVLHRCWRDEAKCRVKYGKAWDEYCALVRWRMLPGIY